MLSFLVRLVEVDDVEDVDVLELGLRLNLGGRNALLGLLLGCRGYFAQALVRAAEKLGEKLKYKLHSTVYLEFELSYIKQGYCSPFP